MGDLKHIPQTNTLLHTFASSMVEKIKHIQQMLVNPTDENTHQKNNQKQAATNSCAF